MRPHLQWGQWAAGRKFTSTYGKWQERRAACASALVGNGRRGGSLCTEGKGPPVRARTRLGRTAGFPGKGRGELAAKRRRKREGGSPPHAGEAAFREEMRPTPNSFVRRGSSLVGGGEMTQDWERCTGEPCPPRGRQDRKQDRIKSKSDIKRHSGVWRGSWAQGEGGE